MGRAAERRTAGAYVRVEDVAASVGVQAVSPEEQAPVPYTVHGISSAPRGRCTVWQCTMCGRGQRIESAHSSTKPMNAKDEALWQRKVEVRPVLSEKEGKRRRKEDACSHTPLFGQLDEVPPSRARLTLAAGGSGGVWDGGLDAAARQVRPVHAAARTLDIYMDAAAGHVKQR